MSALALAPAFPVAGASFGLPDAFAAELNDFDEPVYGQGELREIFPRTARQSRPDPVVPRPGDYILDEGKRPCWLRVDEVTHTATQTLVRTSSGFVVTVTAGHAVWVWRAADVLAWMFLGESAGSR